MKKILVIFLLAGVTFALFPQAAGTEPKDSQPIVVGADGQQVAPANKDVVKTITTKKAYTTTTTVPETTTTVISPERTLEREGLLTWLSIGLRNSVDYHFTPSKGALSCLWLFGEWYNTMFGFQVGVGYLWMPITTYKEPLLGTTYTGEGTRGYVTFDVLGKFYFPFAKWWWAGLGINYAALLGGQLKFVDTASAALPIASATNPNDGLVVNPGRWIDVNAGAGLFYLQAGTGVKIPVGHGFNTINIEPEVRVLIPLSAPTGYGVVLRMNLGVSYAFGL